MAFGLLVVGFVFGVLAATAYFTLRFSNTVRDEANREQDKE